MSTPRTVTVRVRTLVILVGIAAGVGVVWWTLHWATSLAPLSAGGATWGPHGLPVAARTPDAIGDGPTAYRWRRGGRYIVQPFFHNSASIPVTVTGADHTIAGWVGALSGPTLENSTGNEQVQPGPFRAVRVPADGTRVIAFVFRANPRAICEGRGTATSMDSVTVRFTALAIFHDTQTVPLGDAAAVMTGRRC